MDLLDAVIAFMLSPFASLDTVNVKYCVSLIVFFVVESLIVAGSFGMVACFLMTVPQTEQWEPAVFPVFNAVAATAASVTSLWPVALISVLSVRIFPQTEHLNSLQAHRLFPHRKNLQLQRIKIPPRLNLFLR